MAAESVPSVALRAKGALGQVPLQALAAARLLYDLLDPLPRPRPPQHRQLALSSSQASRRLQAGAGNF